MKLVSLCTLQGLLAQPAPAVPGPCWSTALAAAPPTTPAPPLQRTPGDDDCFQNYM